jgi:hypothetical protein
MYVSFTFDRDITLNVRGCHYRKVIDFNNKYRYHKNPIINKGLLLLGGISDCVLQELLLFIIKTM